MSSFLAAVFAIVANATFEPGHAWATDPGALQASASGNSTSGESSEDSPNENLSLMAMGDFNRDGIVDKAVAISPRDHSGPAVLTVLLGQPGGTFKQVSSNLALNHAPRSIVAGDFNGDGIPDLIVGEDDGSLLLFLGDGTGRMLPPGDITHLDSVVSIVVADFNHDNILDIAVTDWRASTVKVFLGTGNGLFRHAWSSPLRMPGTVPHVAAADFNGDGILDLVVVYNDEDEGGTFDVMLGDGKGTFTYTPALSFARDPNSHCTT
jgi:FG-GAP-like repeat